MSKRKLDNHTTAPSKHTKLNDASSSSPFSSDSLQDIASFLPINDLLSLSLTNRHFHSHLNTDATWKHQFQLRYKDRTIHEKDPLFGGRILDEVQEKFSCPFKAQYALQNSFRQLQVLSKENVLEKYGELFEEVEHPVFQAKGGDEGFEPSVEMQQMILSWIDGGECGYEGGNKYGYFYLEECAENEVLNRMAIKNPLTNQGKTDQIRVYNNIIVYLIFEVECSNPYGTFHLENVVTPFACHSEGCSYVNDDNLNTDGVHPCVDFIVWMQRIFCSLCGCPEHGVSYGEKNINVAEWLGFERDEENLLCDQFKQEDE